MTHPDEEYRQMKAWKRESDMLGFVADAQCGIPTRCPCGGTIINEVSRDPKYPTDLILYRGENTSLAKILRDRVDAMAAEIAELKYNLARTNPTTP
ncbi:hypothetical protein Bca52824_011402 [Brassica carinata]|uniref:Uncharacterized protein n=1 Tax=Brassica carinata TaxID=52824 RepID=A0A8X8B8G4_BRACI|nr:hypothetical protein Bca52824_011402 [Brassica carinata]